MNLHARSVKIVAVVLVVALVVALVGYLFATQTFKGRVLTLYAFGGFWAPVSLKYDCAQEANAKVTEKFLLPLKFDESTKNDLREFWHFSYYRACLFRAGYDFGGNKIPRSEIVGKDDGLHYINHFAGTDIKVPAGTTILEDNTTNPDVEDRLIASKLLINGEPVNFYAYRSYDEVASFDALQSSFAHFSTTTAEVTSKQTETNPNGAALITATQADRASGMVTYSPLGRVVEIFGINLPADIGAAIAASLSFITTK